MIDEEYARDKVPVLKEFCRLTLHLPIYSLDERIAAKTVISRFKTEFDGSTYSKVSRDNFIGAWLDDYGVPAEGAVALLITDAPFKTSDEERLIRAMDQIRRFAFMTYRNEGAPQKEIWITAARVLVRYLGKRSD